MKTLDFSIFHRELQFRFEAKTSRNSLRSKDCWIIQAFDKESKQTGLGECSPIWGLSPESKEFLEGEFDKLLQGKLLSPKDTQSPALRFALEQILLDIKAPSHVLFPSRFATGQEGIPINGLVWMNDIPTMTRQVAEKIDAGFHCIKLKVGAQNLNDEIEIIAGLRRQFDPQILEIRLDANGAFNAGTAEGILSRFAQYSIHSIEQPIQPRQWHEMANLVEKKIIPIALDEELIGVEQNRRNDLLQAINPDYLILKPSLLGGFESCEEWISLGAHRNIGWWATSMLESNLGLNAIAHWTTQFDNPLRHGLGTGQLYHNNFASPLEIRGEQLWHNPEKNWDFNNLFDSRQSTS